jgi:hypothetical protein
MNLAVKIGMNLLSSILIMVGGLLGLLSVFMAWFEISIGWVTVSMSGWEIIRESVDGMDGGYVQWTPLIVMIFSVIALLIGLSTLVKPHKAAGMGALVSGILVLIGAILFYTYTEKVGLVTLRMSDYLGTGVYLAIVAGIIIIIFGALRMMDKGTK